MRLLTITIFTTFFFCTGIYPDKSNLFYSKQLHPPCTTISSACVENLAPRPNFSPRRQTASLLQAPHSFCPPFPLAPRPLFTHSMQETALTWQMTQTLSCVGRLAHTRVQTVTGTYCYLRKGVQRCNPCSPIQLSTPTTSDGVHIQPLLYSVKRALGYEKRVEYSLHLHQGTLVSR